MKEFSVRRHYLEENIYGYDIVRYRRSTVLFSPCRRSCAKWCQVICINTNTVRSSLIILFWEILNCHWLFVSFSMSSKCLTMVLSVLLTQSLFIKLHLCFVFFVLCRFRSGPDRLSVTINYSVQNYLNIRIFGPCSVSRLIIN